MHEHVRELIRSVSLAFGLLILMTIIVVIVSIIVHHFRNSEIRIYGLANGRAGLFLSPAPSERCHRSLARRLVAVRRHTVLVVAVSQCP